MFHIFSDIIGVLTSFGVVDYILYFAMVLLIILIISLIYVIKSEKNDINSNVEVSKVEEPEKEEIDLNHIVESIEENPKPLIDMTAYEEEQEKKAIISYDELIKSAKQKTINYQDEELVDNVIPVKKIQVSEMTLPESLLLKEKEPPLTVDTCSKPNTEVHLFAYEKEEAFLKALQKLNELLN